MMSVRAVATGLPGRLERVHHAAVAADGRPGQRCGDPRAAASDRGPGTSARPAASALHRGGPGVAGRAAAPAAPAGVAETAATCTPGHGAALAPGADLEPTCRPVLAQTPGPAPYRAFDPPVRNAPGQGEPGWGIGGCTANCS